ncbi:hypothetical protein GQ55_1G228800 [Panicum hallii var. hallii]|uniref:Uncharacterized protein n=1 Tax=Panicum hallii var. hallii TaxID=1504633 RepID=A0A2T7F6M0_9POAL|nr:hypothetical protein GQ55_1G228800 [Panicum hallii var. hallii]
MVDNVTCRQSSSILLMLSCIQTKSLCWINLGDGEKALLDAEFCRMMHPDWPKACYRQGAAHMLLKNNEKACDAFLDGLKLDGPNKC